MADTSLIIGNGNWAVKETSLLGYNIIQSKYVPIGMTVSRNTTATRVNSAGLIELVPRNLLTYSQQIDNADWVKTNAPTITTNIAVAPDGTTTADGIKADDAVNFKSISQTKTVTANSTVTTSVFVKKETSETNFGGFAYIFTGVTTKILRVTVNAVTGTVQLTTDSTLTATTNVEDYGAYWRISATTTDNGSNTSLQYAYYGTLSTNGTNTVQAVGSVRTVWGFQLEVGTTATEYFPTTDRFNIPRVDYLNSTTGSLLVEPARTNEVLYSADFDNASWNGVNRMITANVTTAPDNTMTADKFIPDNTNGAHNIHRTGLASDAYTFSVFAKAGEETTFSMWLRTASVGAVFDLSTGTITSNSASIIPKIEPYPKGWYRCSVYDATPGTTAHIYGRSGGGFIGNNVNGFFIWGAQAEAGTTVTSYIPTVAGPISRNADVISKTGISSLIGQTEGTIFMDLNFTNVGVDKYIVVINNTANTNSIAIRRLSGGAIRTVLTATTTSGTTSQSSAVLANGNYKIAYRYISGSIKLYINGALSFSETPTFTFGAAIENIKLGMSNGNTEQLNDSINSFQLYQTALSHDQCIDLTT